MKYNVKTITINELIGLISSGKLNLRPQYQRNFIWTPKDQKLLIDSINNGYPLPNFFIYDCGNGTFEMVDGQQRAVTINKYYRGEFADSSKRRFSDIEKQKFLSYNLVVIYISDLDSKNDSIEEFYALVNKRGVHLNPSEVNKAAYHDSQFMQLVNRAMENQNLIDLDIFTDKVKIRMNDRSLIEEILAYLYKGCITDKRNAVDELFGAELDSAKAEEVYKRFCEVLEVISKLNQIRPIKDTRYKQRNDFYTLFCFINENLDEDEELMNYQYRTLVWISDEGYITPSNDDCEPFKEYAINCVSQSNSKAAREARLKFMNELLKCSLMDNNPIYNDILPFVAKIYNITKLQTKKISNRVFIDIDTLES